MGHDEVVICTQRGTFYAIEHAVCRWMELRTNFYIIHGAFVGERIGQLGSDFGNGVYDECKLYPCEL